MNVSMFLGGYACCKDDPPDRLLPPPLNAEMTENTIFVFQQASFTSSLENVMVLHYARVSLLQATRPLLVTLGVVRSDGLRVSKGSLWRGLRYRNRSEIRISAKSG